MDFYAIHYRKEKKGKIEVYPEFYVKDSKDLMIRGGAFRAAWDEEHKIWTEDIYFVARSIDRDIRKKIDELSADPDYRNCEIVGHFVDSYSNGVWTKFKNYLKLSKDSYHDLNHKIVFADTEVTREDYASKRLPYSLCDEEPVAYNELMDKLYAPEERRKIEWAIGSVFAGDSVKIQKFLVLYGEGGTGKSTVLDIIRALFGEKGDDDKYTGIYWSDFRSQDLISNSNQFKLESLKNNPLIAIDPDTKMDRIEDNSVLNSIVSHESQIVNVKNQNLFSIKFVSMLFMGTNSPVKITDVKSGLIRRLIDVNPTGNTFDYDRYMELIGQIDFELGKIANHCLNVYRELGINYYGKYKAWSMILETNEFYNFIVDNEDAFTEHGGITRKAAYDLYKKYVEEAGLKYLMPLNRFTTEFKAYFEKFEERPYIDGVQVRKWYSGFKSDKFRTKEAEKNPQKYFLNLDQTVSLFDKEYSWIPAAYAWDDNGGPKIKDWDSCKTTLKDIDTSKVHFCRPPENMIVIDFDFKDENGNKSPELNLMEASKWPPTYAEFSKSGGGIHLHYFYPGDVKMLLGTYGPGIDIRTFSGNQSLRRKLIRCNNLPIATITSGLPIKEVTNTIDNVAVQNEKHLMRRIVSRMMNKDKNGLSTRQTILLIKKDLDEAYESGIHYDITALKPDILAFANNSTNSAQFCVQQVGQMKFKSEEATDALDTSDDAPIVFFDIEVYKNLLLLCWKFRGPQYKVNVIFNPSPAYLETFFKMKLAGYNNLNYDNPILYYRYEGASTLQCYEMSKGLIGGTLRPSAESKSVSYTDVFDFIIKKQSLKKWEVELMVEHPERNYHHEEMYLDWDQPAPEDKWDLIAQYCCNDVIMTEAVFEENYADFEARQILVEMCNSLGIKASVNDTTNQLTTKLITRGVKKPQTHYVYTDLSTIFPGYKYENGKSTYRGIETGEGGLVYSKPGMYRNVWTFDVDSMHPHSALALNYFGDLTPNFKELVDLRMLIKSGKFDEVAKMFNGALVKYIDMSDPDATKKKLGGALKLAINSVYGLTAAHFENALRLPQNDDNIVAKYGALFMKNLWDEVVARGYEVVHIKTDSIKIVEPKQDIVDFINDYAAKYGFKFKIESKYERFCLVNKAVYIAKEEDGHWSPTGAQFAHPYVLKRLFTKQRIELKDMAEMKSVTTTMYLDFNENKPEGEHSYYFVGKVGLFVPVKPGTGGGELLRAKDDKYSAVTGTKGYRWKEFETVKMMKWDDQIDYTYFDKLVEEAKQAISKYGDFEEFTRDDENKVEVA